MKYIATKLWNDLTQLPYYSGFELEEAVEQVLQENGYIDISNDPACKHFLDNDWHKNRLDRSFLKHRQFNDSDLLSLGVYDDHVYYVREPFGGKSNPDFMLIVYGRVIFLECKSGKERNYKWNNSIPKKDYLYLMSCGATNRSTLIMGQRMIDPVYGYFLNKETRQAQVEASNNVRERMNLRFPEYSELNPHNWSGDFRVQFEPSGPEIDGVKNNDFVEKALITGWDKEALKFMQKEFEKAPNRALLTA